MPGDFLGNAPSTQLLILMCFPLTGALLLAVFLFFSMRGRRRKNQMKHEVKFKQKIEMGAPVGEVTAAPARPLAGFEPEKPAQPLPPVDDLNLAVLSKPVVREDVTMETRSAKPETVDLASRLGNQPPAKEPVELLRLLRHPQTGQLIVEVAGRRYNKLTDINEKDVGQFILELVAHLLAFTNGIIATETGVKSVYLPKVKQTPMPIVASPAVSRQPASAVTSPPPAPTPPPEPESTSAEPELVPKPSPEAEAAFLASLRAQPLSQPEPPKPRGGLFGRPKVSSPEPGQLLAGFNLAEEINKIVQNRLMLSPLADITKIDILSDSAGGILIKVNGHIYVSPDDIADPQVKTLIKESIKQWERS